jgi:NAD(P)H-nitrite reductase large subunit
VGTEDIGRALRRCGCTDVESLGLACRAGTGCGACRSELEEIIDAWIGRIAV